jgi:hypothetical protein
MTYAYEIILDGEGGRFVVDGDRLEVAGSLVPPGLYSVTLRAIKPDGWSETKPFEIQIVQDLARKTFARSSAGVYSGGVLIRTLWSEKPFDGLIDGHIWDGLDDNGAVAASGDYTLKVLDTSGVTDEWLGAVGNNSYPWPWYQSIDQCHGMAITDTGKIYLVIGYYEGRNATLKSTVADPLTYEFVLPVTYRLTGPVAHHVATDNKRAYFAGNNVGVPGVAPHWTSTSFVWAVTVADDVAHTFSSGTGVIKGGVTYSGACVVVSTDGVFPNYPRNYFGSGLITGLAVQVAGDFLFVTRQFLNSLYVVNKMTGALIATTTSLTEPTRICVDHNDDLWITSKSGAGWIVAKYKVSARTGALALVPGSTLNGFSEPLALSVTPDGAVIRIADGGKSQQIKSYSNVTYAPQGTYGQAGGYASGPDVTADKFQFYHDCWITWPASSGGWQGGRAWSWLAHQPDGKLWVGDPSNARNMRFSISGVKYTYAGEISWVPLGYATSIDSNDATRVFSDWREYRIDYSKKFPEKGWWTLVKNWKFNVPLTHDDPYFRMNRTTTLSNGRTYCLLRSRLGGVEIAELTPKGLRLTGVTDPAIINISLMPNGDLHYVNAPLVGSPIVFEKKALTGFNRLNNPTYSAKKTFVTTPKRIAEDPAPATLVFPQPWQVTANGTIGVYEPRKQHAGYHMAGVDAATGAWKFKTLPSVPTNRYRWTDSVTRRFMGEDDWPRGYFDITPVSSAGNICFTIGSSFIAGYHGEGFAVAQANKWWHYHESGLLVSSFGVVLEGEGDNQPGLAGNAGRGSSVALQDGTTSSSSITTNFTVAVRTCGASTIQTLSSSTSSRSPGTPEASRRRKPIPTICFSLFRSTRRNWPTTRPTGRAARRRTP